MLVTGCSHMKHQELTASGLASLKDQTIVQTGAPAPGFMTLTVGDVVGGALGALAGATFKDPMGLSKKLPDPAVSMNSTLAALLASKGARIAPQRLTVPDADVAQIADAARSSGRYVLDVRTVSWLITYLPTAWKSYGLAYTASARLIDTQSKTVVAQGYCNQSFDKTVNPPSWNDMMKDDFARLKQELDITAQACTNIFSSQMSLGAPGPMVHPALATQIAPSPPLPTAAATSAARPSVAPPPAAQASAVPPSVVPARQPAYVAQKEIYPLQQAALPPDRPLDPYDQVMAEVQRKHNRLNPDSVYYSQDLFDWVMARKVEHMKAGLAAPQALRRAVENMEHP